MLTVEALKEYGADVDAGLSRCLNNSDFYLRLVKMASEDAGFDNLQNAVSSGDLDAAFEAAHALKGVLGNLALTPLYTPVSELTEALRARSASDYTPYLEQIVKSLRALKELM